MNPQLKTFFFGAFMSAFVVLIGLKSCDKPNNLSPETPKLIVKANTQEANIKAKEAKVKAKEARLKVEESKADSIKAKSNKNKANYLKVRHDSTVKPEIKLVYCDTLIKTDSTLIAAKDSIIEHERQINLAKDSIITDLHSLVGTWKQVHSVDSIDHTREIKKLKWKVVKANVRTGAIVLLVAIKEGYQFVKP